MNNRGRITVFLCLTVSALLIVGMTAFEVIKLLSAKEKTAIAARSSVSGVKAGYNSYIFEHYHILLFDKNCGGMGEAALEEQIKADMQYNLGDGYVVEDIALTGFDLIYENDCLELKEQIGDYMKYAAIEYGADRILEATGGKDGTVSKELFDEMDADTENDKHDDKKADISLSVDDPRDFTDDMSDSVLLSIVVPDDMKISGEIVNLEGMPSIKHFGFAAELFSADDSFDNYSVLKADLKQHDSWKDSLLDAGVGLAYARDVFNCATAQDVNEDTVFGCELEYLIAGRASDRENLEAVVRRLLLVRLPVNYTYLLSDKSKMSQVRAVAGPLSLVVFIPEPILKYLIAGCWSYVESMAEVRALLEGKKLPFAKTKDNWVTDINNLEDSVKNDISEDSNGLGYKDYLAILIAFDMDRSYYRMLDIMELNVRQHEPGFRIENGSVGLSVDIGVIYGGRRFDIREQGGY